MAYDILISFKATGDIKERLDRLAAAELLSTSAVLRRLVHQALPAVVPKAHAEDREH